MSVFPRRTGIASVAVLAGITLTIGFAHAVAPGWVRTAGLDVWAFGDVAADYQNASMRGDELDEVQGRLNEQVAVTNQVIGLLIAGRITLPAAAAELEEINLDRPGFADTLACNYPDTLTYRGQLARYVLTKVRSRLADDPTQLAEVSARLDDEYQRMAGDAADAR